MISPCPSENRQHLPRAAQFMGKCCEAALELWRAGISGAVHCQPPLHGDEIMEVIQLKSPFSSALVELRICNGVQRGITYSLHIGVIPYG